MTITKRDVYEIGFNEGEDMASNSKELLKVYSTKKYVEILLDAYILKYVIPQKTMNPHLGERIKQEKNKDDLFDFYNRGVKAGLVTRAKFLAKAIRVNKTITRTRVRPGSTRNRPRTARRV